MVMLIKIFINLDFFYLARYDGLRGINVGPTSSEVDYYYDDYYYYYYYYTY